MLVQLVPVLRAMNQASFCRDHKVRLPNVIRGLLY